MRKEDCKRSWRKTENHSDGFLNQLTENALTRKDMEIEEGEIPNTYVEGRNHIFLSFAAIYAKTIGAKNIITGVSETEFSGYPDCRDEFIQSLNTTLNLAMDDQFKLITPLMWKDKAEVWEMADQMGRLEYIRENTLTCYKGVIGDGCGKCPACKLRNDGLQTYLQGGALPYDSNSNLFIINYPSKRDYCKICSLWNLVRLLSLMALYLLD